MSSKDFYNNSYSWDNKDDNSNKASGDYNLGYLKTIIDTNINSVIDIGAGRGNMLDTIKSLNDNIEKFVGVELVEDAVKILKNKGYESYNIDMGNESVDDLGKFDLILSFHVLEHVFSTDHFIKELIKLMHKNSVLVIEVPNLGWWLGRLLLLFGYNPFQSVENHDKVINFGVPGIFKDKLNGYSSAGHIRGFTLSGLIDMFKYYGFEVLKIEGHGSNKFVPKSLSRAIRIYLKKKG